MKEALIPYEKYSQADLEYRSKHKSWLFKAEIPQLPEIDERILNGEIEPPSDNVRRLVERMKRREARQKPKRTERPKAKRIRSRGRNLRSLPHTLTDAEWEEIKRHFGHKCAYCGKKRPLQREHFIPLSKGGEYTHNNIIPACAECNWSKLDRDFNEWYPAQPFYSEARERRILRYLNYDGNMQQLRLLV
jgi:5-methylcytosine-specific restriction endonuclease McrA